MHTVQYCTDFSRGRRPTIMLYTFFNKLEDQLLNLLQLKLNVKYKPNNTNSTFKEALFRSQGNYQPLGEPDIYCTP